MKDSLHIGEWFLPNSNLKLPGKLIFDNKNKIIILELFGDKYLDDVPVIKNDPNRDKRYHSEDFNDNFKKYHSLVLGEASGHTTLYSCQWHGNKKLGKGIYKVKYKVEFVFSGVHLKEDNTILVRGGTFIFPYLSTWYDGEMFLYKLKGKQGLYVEGKHVIQNVSTDDKITINHELSLNLWDEVKEDIEEINISYKVKFQKYIRFQYEIDVPFKRLLQNAVTFLKLLQFCFGKPLNFQIISANIDLKHTTEEDSYSQIAQEGYKLVYVSNYTLSKKTKIESHSSHSRYMLLSRWTCSQEEMNQFIINWYKNEKFFNIYEYYIDSNNWMQGTDAKLSNVMFNNRFLNLIQALEDYHREHLGVIPNSADHQLFKKNKETVLNLIKNNSPLKNWLHDNLNPRDYFTLKEKLSTIIKDLLPELSKLLHGIVLDEFSISAKDFRNALSHATNKEINQGIRLYEDYLIAQILLGTCILKTLGVKNILERIAYYSNFVDAAYQIKLNQNQRLVSTEPDTAEP